MQLCKCLTNGIKGQSSTATKKRDTPMNTAAESLYQKIQEAHKYAQHKGSTAHVRKLMAAVHPCSPCLDLKQSNGRIWRPSIGGAPSHTRPLLLCSVARAIVLMPRAAWMPRGYIDVRRRKQSLENLRAGARCRSWGSWSVAHTMAPTYANQSAACSSRYVAQSFVMPPDPT